MPNPRILLKCLGKTCWQNRRGNSTPSRVTGFIFVLFLDNSLNVLGYYKHTKGTPNAVMVDIPMILGISVKAMARFIVLSHNHPSGKCEPSEADRKITVDMKKAAKLLKLEVLDHF
jgi:DNA repair protein RadC